MDECKPLGEAGEGETTTATPGGIPKHLQVLTKWQSGDFAGKLGTNSGGGGGDGGRGGGRDGGSPTATSSPAFATAVSAAAAAAVADKADTPTLILGPSALRWLRRFTKVGPGR